jgi:small GTP-binding protein
MEKPGVTPKRVVAVGPAEAGKTTLLHYWQGHAFGSVYGSTVGAEFTAIERFTGSMTAVTLHLWDTAGQERFAALAPVYLRKAEAVLLVFDASSAKSEQLLLKEWVPRIESACPDAPRFLVAAKSDLLELSGELVTRGYDLAKQLNCRDFFLTSARTGEGCESLLDAVVEAVDDGSSDQLADFDADWARLAPRARRQRGCCP